MTVQRACRFLGASRLAGTPGGYRWDCGILQARLNHDAPVDLDSYPYPLLDGLYLDGTFPRIAADRRAFGWTAPRGGVICSRRLPAASRIWLDSRVGELRGPGRCQGGLDTVY